MKKKILGSLLVTSLFLSTQALASSDTSTLDTGRVLSEIETSSSSDAEVSPMLVMEISKKITKTYSSISDVPQDIYYEEYTQGVWFSGRLYLDQVTRTTSGRYNATFSGTLYGRP